MTDKKPEKMSVLSCHSSTWIEGNLLSLAQVRAVSEGQDVLVEKNQKLEVANCIAAMRSILNNKNKIATEKDLLAVHALMIKGLLPTARTGKYRIVQNYVVDARKRVIFTPPAPAKVSERMKDLFSWLKDNDQHPIVRSAVFHHEFLTIHPFVDGNGRVARAIAQWLLWERGIDPLVTLGLDDFFAQDRARYYDMIQQTRDMDGDYTHWVEYVAEGLRNSVQIVQSRIKEGSLKLAQTALTPKQEELVVLVEKHGVLGAAQICKEMKVNRARVNQLILPLVRSGLVVRTGAARAVRYRLSVK
ncbi:MAG: Fic family protein [Candidatus Omnitrophica bacterium]|nr:Fic family protein [Candidatus Omnitrophota bacterium]